MATVKILDGGMGRELKRMGAPFQQPEWSALALMQGPQFVRQAHDAFVQGGAQIITTNSYAVVPFHIGQERFDARGVALARLAGELARASADAATHPLGNCIHEGDSASSLKPEESAGESSCTDLSACSLICVYMCACVRPRACV